MKYLLTIYKNNPEAVDLFSEMIEDQGLKAETSFDKRIQEDDNITCSCPHHGTSKCDCQIVVLLIYGNSEGPGTVVAHSRDGRTVFSLAVELEEPQAATIYSILEKIKITAQLPR